MLLFYWLDHKVTCYYGCRIIIIIQMSLVEAGSLVGGVIGSPVSLDMKKVDSTAPPADNKGAGAGVFGSSSGMC